jgi:hypothetical protein
MWLKKLVETIKANKVSWITIALVTDVDPEEELRRLERLQQGWARHNLSQHGRAVPGGVRSIQPTQASRSQATGRSPAFGPIEGFKPQTWLYCDDFDSLQTVGALKLDAWHRKRLQWLLRAYEVLKLGVAERPAVPREEIQKLARRLGKIVEVIKTDRDQWLEIAAFAELALEDELRRLESLQRACSRLHALRRQGRLPDDLMLPSLLFGLEAIFVNAGGTARGIAHNDYDQREGPILNFMWGALRHLPEDLRPSSQQALGSRWERLYQQRKKGGNNWFEWSTNERVVQSLSDGRAHLICEFCRPD